MEILGKELRSALEEAREMSRERDLLLSQAQNYAVFNISTDGVLQGWNTGVLRVLGYSEEEFTGKPFAVLFTPDDAEKREPEYELDQARQFGRCIENRYHVRKDGAMIWIDGTVVAVYDEAGGVKKYSKIMRDDSVRKSMEEEIQRLQAHSQNLAIQ